MRKMLKIFTTLTFMLLIFGLVSCGEQNNPTPNEDSVKNIYYNDDNQLIVKFESGLEENLGSIDVVTNIKIVDGELIVEFALGSSVNLGKYIGELDLNDLVGPKGDKGDPGKDGEQGPKGDKGDSGKDGEEGPKGDPGQDGKDGEQGPKGDKGDSGENGKTPIIGENGNWFIDGIDTGISATGHPNQDRIGSDGLVFQVVIIDGEAGYEVIEYNGSEKNLVIPNEIFGQKVISISKNASINSVESISISKHTKSLPIFKGFSEMKLFDFNNAPIKELSNEMFRNNVNLETILNYENIEHIGNYAFNGTKILFNKFSFDNIKHIGEYAFYDTSSQNYYVDFVIYVKEGEEIIVSEETYIYLTDNVEYIGHNAFPRDFLIYYQGSNNLDFESENLFYNVRKYNDEYFYVEHEDHIGILNYFGELNEIAIPNKINNKPVTKIENYAFIGDNQLSAIYLPNTVTEIGHLAFFLTQNLYLVYIPNSFTSIKTSFIGLHYERLNNINFTDPVFAFESLKSNITVGKYDEEFPNNVDARILFGVPIDEIKQDDDFVYREVGSSFELIAIKNKKGSIVIPSSFNNKSITRISSYALLLDNGGINKIEISNGIKYISTNAFWESKSLNMVFIPKSIEAVNYQGFNYLRNTNIYINQVEKPSNWDSNWYSDIKNIYWNIAEIPNVEFYNDFAYKVENNEVTIVKYEGVWNQYNPIIIPETINGLPVTRIAADSIEYSNTNTWLEIQIPNSVTTIEENAITVYYGFRVYTNHESRPEGWHENGINSVYYNNNNSYKVYYWNRDI